MTSVYLLVFIFVGFAQAGVPNHDRVVDQALSDEPKDSPEYDHEAFLGSERAAEFKKLDPQESERRLGVLADKIDKDGDGKVDEKELEEWITFTQARYVNEDSTRQLDTYDKNKDGKVHWDEYKETSYGFLREEDLKEDSENKFSYNKMIARDERRWNAADTDDDRILTEEEFAHFLHPEDFVRMRDIVARETLEDIDKDGDGFIDVEEYLGDMFNEEEGGEKPVWIDSEREQFVQFRDKDKDGKMDVDEVKAWIFPQTQEEHVKMEVKHLIEEADDNKDGALTRDEFMAHHDTFVGSQATDFGEVLARHDEF
uniref:Reticulocalbin-3 n=1 Tax=Phallusia mammillata TaxID=59560 RepID=A0A6F9D8F7_9ASCI|nr:calumenin-B-like [Phallusia mammillata]